MNVERNNMTTPNIVTRPLHLIWILVLSHNMVIIHPSATNLCGKISIEHPFTLKKTTRPESSPTTHVVLLCTSNKLYFRTSIGQFLVSSIDYKTKLLTISHPHSSSSQNFISPLLLPAGFPSTPQPNSLLLINCSSPRKSTFPILKNCSRFHNSNKGGRSDRPLQCLLVDNVNKLRTGFDPREMNCSHYLRVHRKALGGNFSDHDKEEFELGTRISFDIPDHVPDICAKCKNPNEICGAALRCLCHPKECCV